MLLVFYKCFVAIFGIKLIFGLLGLRTNGHSDNKADPCTETLTTLYLLLDVLEEYCTAVIVGLFIIARGLR